MAADGGQLAWCDTPTLAAWADQLGLVKPIDRLRQRVVMAINPNTSHPERLQPDTTGGRLTKEPRVDSLHHPAAIRITNGPGFKAVGLAMEFKLRESAQDRWQAINGPQLVALVRARVHVDQGRMIERPDEFQGVAA